MTALLFLAGRRNLADILSVLAMTASEEGSRESLRFRLEGGGESVGVWGHEYVRCGGLGAKLERNDSVLDRMACGARAAGRCPGRWPRFGLMHALQSHCARSSRSRGSCLHLGCEGTAGFLKMYPCQALNVVWPCPKNASGSNKTAASELACARLRLFRSQLERCLPCGRNLAGEIGEEWEARSGKGESVEDLLALVKQIVPYHMGHNAETDAVDLLSRFVASTAYRLGIGWERDC